MNLVKIVTSKAGATLYRRSEDGGKTWHGTSRDTFITLIAFRGYRTAR